MVELVFLVGAGVLGVVGLWGIANPDKLFGPRHHIYAWVFAIGGFGFLLVQALTLMEVL